MLLTPEADGYRSATQPHNSASPQRPVAVAVVSSPDEIPDVLNEAATRSSEHAIQVVPQATGHGAGAVIDEHSVILDTSRLNSVSIDPHSRVATVGAGATWAQVNAAAERHGLLGLAGSAPSVSVSGYTFGGGIGWLVRRDGFASGALRRVHYIDGHGVSRIAADDAADQLDQDAIWAFRGAGGVGIAHTLEFDLFPAQDLHAGALLWHGDALISLVDAWSATIGAVGAGVSSSLAVLHIPPAPPFPKELRGSVAVHLAIADPDGPTRAAPLLEAMRAVARPVVDDWGPKDAAGLARIHLDPPTAVPAIGDARWLDASTPHIAAALLGTAAAADAPLIMLEIRHVAGAPIRREGAVTAPPGGFIYHAVGALGRSTREEIDAGFARARDIWASGDTGITPGSWIEGAPSVASALTPGVRERATVIADAVDPGRRISRSRLLG